MDLKANKTFKIQGRKTNHQFLSTQEILDLVAELTYLRNLNGRSQLNPKNHNRASTQCTEFQSKRTKLLYRSLLRKVSLKTHPPTAVKPKTKYQKKDQPVRKFVRTVSNREIE